jgi:formylglycine-generating enzyme required for sulfatase activity
MNLGAMADTMTQPVEGTALAIDLVRVADATGEGGRWVSRTEIPWELYDVFVFRLDGSDEKSDAPVDAISRPSKPYIAMDRGFGHAGYPAISPSFQGATEFCKWLSLKTGRTYRLPTEAEWTDWCERSGITAENATEHAWLKDNADFKTHPAGTLAPDALGLSDLWGNASEWCSTGAENDKGVIRGGSYKQTGEEAGCAFREEPKAAWNASDPQFPKSMWWLADAGFIGFRVVCEDE